MTLMTQGRLIMTHTSGYGKIGTCEPIITTFAIATFDPWTREQSNKNLVLYECSNMGQNIENRLAAFAP